MRCCSGAVTKTAQDLERSSVMESTLPHIRLQGGEFRESADNPSILFPTYIRHDEEDLDLTYYGMHGEDLVDMYAWPLLWTGGYTGKSKLFQNFPSFNLAIKKGTILLTRSRFQPKPWPGPCCL